MGRPTGHRLTAEQKQKISASKKAGWILWRLRTEAGKNPPRYGGRKPGSKSAHPHPHKPTIHRTEHARTPDEKTAIKDTLQSGASVVSRQSLRHPRFLFKLPNGEIRVDYLDERLEITWPTKNNPAKK